MDNFTRNYYLQTQQRKTIAVHFGTETAQRGFYLRSFGVNVECRETEIV